MTNDTALKQHYDTHGYVVVPSLFNASEVQLLRNTTDQIIESARGKSESDSIHDLEDSHNPTDTPRVRRIKDPVQQFDTYGTLARNEKLLSILRTLLGTNVRFHSSKINIKSAAYGAAVEWHQDWAFYPHTNDDLLAVGVAIDDMTEENGPLLVIPGSHKGPIYDHNLDGHFCGAVTDPAFSDKTAVSVMVEAGGITIHHVRMLHGSIANTSDYPRRLLLFQYCAIDAFPLHGLNDWDLFNETVVRGEPTNIPRVEPVPVRMPYPPALRKGSIYESQSVLKESNFGKR